MPTTFELVKLQDHAYTVAKALNAGLPLPQDGPDALNWTLMRDIPLDRLRDKASGYNAAVYFNAAGEFVIVHVGSEEFRDFAVDAGIARGVLPKAQLDAANNLVSDLREGFPDAPIWQTGHSLGGLLAELSTAYQLTKYLDRNIYALTIASPGGRQFMKEIGADPDLDYKSRIMSIYRAMDPVRMGESIGTEIRLGDGPTFCQWYGQTIIRFPQVGVGLIASHVRADHLLGNYESALSQRDFELPPAAGRAVNTSLADMQSLFGSLGSLGGQRTGDVVIELEQQRIVGPRLLGGEATSSDPLTILQGSLGPNPFGDASRLVVDDLILNSTDRIHTPLTLSLFTDDDRSVLEQLRDEGVLEPGLGSTEINTSPTSAQELALAVNSTSLTGSSGDSSRAGAPTTDINDSSPVAVAALAGLDGAVPVDTSRIVTDIVPPPAVDVGAPSTSGSSDPSSDASTLSISTGASSSSDGGSSTTGFGFVPLTPELPTPGVLEPPPPSPAAGPPDLGLVAHSPPPPPPDFGPPDLALGAPSPLPPAPVPAEPPPPSGPPPVDEIWFPDPMPVPMIAPPPPSLPPLVYEPPPIFYQPPPIFSQPPPVVYEPPPVFYEPPPIFYEPPPVFSEPSPIFYEPPPIFYNPPPISFDFSGGFSFFGFPLVVDLDGAGLDLVSLATSTTSFDMDGDGVRNRTGWVGPDDGLLVEDFNHDGKIGDINEISFSRFGEPGATDLEGFAAAFDSDHNGVFDPRDQGFGEVQVWRDANQDGQTDRGELKSLADWGITAIGMERKDSEVPEALDGRGNILFGTSSFTRADGSVGTVGDVAFAFLSGASQGPQAQKDEAAGGTGKAGLAGAAGQDRLRGGPGDDPTQGELGFGLDPLGEASRGPTVDPHDPNGRHESETVQSVDGSALSDSSVMDPAVKPTGAAGDDTLTETATLDQSLRSSAFRLETGSQGATEAGSLLFTGITGGKPISPTGPLGSEGSTVGPPTEGGAKDQNQPVPALETAKGDVLRAQQVEQLVQAMAAFGTPPLSGQAGLTVADPQSPLEANLAAALEPTASPTNSVRT
ncbi:MAG: hypothetical protein E6K58_09100 [Nitrospirae bacterium]|nr:MAG: hypothetical protein E6K58_09100 [Nitrospirota bacterium]